MTLDATQPDEDDAIAFLLSTASQAMRLVIRFDASSRVVHAEASPTVDSVVLTEILQWARELDLEDAISFTVREVHDCLSG